MEDVDIDAELLISMVEEMPVLWDKSLEAYKSKTETIAAWKEICIQINPDFGSMSEDAMNKYGKQISAKWTNLRDRYMKYVKKLEEEKTTGSKAKSFRKYLYSDIMSVLQKNTKRKETVSSAVYGEKEENNYENDETSQDTQIKENTQTLKRDTPSDPQPSTQGKIKRHKALMTDIEKSILNKLQEPENRHVNFFKGILPSLQMFDENEILEFQREVIKIIQSIKKTGQTPRSSTLPVPSEHVNQPSPHLYHYYPDDFTNKLTNWRYSFPQPPNVGASSYAMPGFTVLPTATYARPDPSPHSGQSNISANSGEDSHILDLDLVN